MTPQKSIPSDPADTTEMPEQQLVRQFHQAFDLPTRSMPTLIPLSEQSLRIRLIHEEFCL